MGKKLPPMTPGEILLEEFLKPMKISQSRLAKDINVPPNRISQIIHGRREITADTALRLGRYFNIEPEFWINLQTRYNMKQARRKIGTALDKEVKVRCFAAARTDRAVT
ncbi:MAG: HigA family addiction module antitoxin [Candidatus Electrothrix communis]|nr:MAG: HigA family addiction module antitoxin [Candidatus Electrothrix communis]